jgi:hypothetical protein
VAGGGNQDRLLFYFTDAAELPSLLRARVLSADEPMAGALRGLVTSRGGGLVWFSDSGAADVRPGVRGRADQLVRITTVVAGAQYWPRWARRHLVGRRRRRRIDASAGGSSGRWWVAARPVPAAAWLRIDTAAGKTLWPETEHRPVGTGLVPSAYRRSGVDWPASATFHVPRHRPRPS